MSAWVRLIGAATVVYGPGDIDWAHSADERVSLEATERVAHVLVQATEAAYFQAEGSAPAGAGATPG